MKHPLSLLFLAGLLSMSAADSQIPPQFPRVRGVYQMTDTWSVTLPSDFAKRFEEGDLVLWRKGLTCWTVVYDLKDGETPKQRLDWLMGEASEDAVERWESVDAMPLRYAYLLHEKEETGERWALYTFTVGDSSHVMMAVYFDRKEDLAEACAIGMSIAQKKAPNQPQQTTTGSDAPGRV